MPTNKQSRTRTILADIVASILLLSLAQELLFHSFRTSRSIIFTSVAVMATLLGPALYVTIRYANYSATKEPGPFWRAFGIGFLASISAAFVVAGFRPKEPDSPSKTGNAEQGEDGKASPAIS